MKKKSNQKNNFITKDNSELKSKIARLEQEVINLRGRLAQDNVLHDEYTKTKEELDKLVENYNSVCLELARYKRANNSLQERIELLEKSDGKDALIERIRSLQDMISNYRLLQDFVNKCDCDWKKLLYDNSALANLAKEYKSEVEQKDTIIKNLQEVNIESFNQGKQVGYNDGYNACKSELQNKQIKQLFELTDLEKGLLKEALDNKRKYENGEGLTITDTINLNARTPDGRVNYIRLKDLIVKLDKLNDYVAMSTLEWLIGNKYTYEKDLHGEIKLRVNRYNETKDST